jgi:hypothetical protein
MPELVAEILRVAVQLAIKEQFRSLKEMEAKLQRLYPNQDNEIREALTLWANS